MIIGYSKVNEKTTEFEEIQKGLKEMEKSLVTEKLEKEKLSDSLKDQKDEAASMEARLNGELAAAIANAGKLMQDCKFVIIAYVYIRLMVSGTDYGLS